MFRKTIWVNLWIDKGSWIGLQDLKQPWKLELFTRVRGLTLCIRPGNWTPPGVIPSDICGGTRCLSFAADPQIPEWFVQNLYSIWSQIPLFSLKHIFLHTILTFSVVVILTIKITKLTYSNLTCRNFIYWVGDIRLLL